MQTWVKPSGARVQVNELSEAKARELGWIPEDELNRKAEQIKAEEKPRKRRGRPPKSEAVSNGNG